MPLIIIYGKHDYLIKTHLGSKKKCNEEFDVLMGSFEREEVCESVGTDILNKLKDAFQHHLIGVYENDSLAAVKGSSGQEIERLWTKNYH